jgi:FkbM family methyltransferase
MNENTLVFVGCNKSSDLDSFVGAHDRSILIEPLPDIADELRHRFPAAQVIEAACSDIDGRIPFFRYNEDGLSSSVARITEQTRQLYTDVDWTLVETIEVDAKKLPDLLTAAGVNRITTLFIDAQGMDFTILQTMEDWFRWGRVDFLQTEAEALGFQHYDGLDNDAEKQKAFMSRFDYESVPPPMRNQHTPDLRWRLKTSHVSHVFLEEGMKLNIGAGDQQLPGFEPIDRKFGREAYPLSNEDNSVEEIRASHVLEHFPCSHVLPVLKEWVRTLKPGGLIKLAVPDIDRLDRNDPLWPHYLMGGQTDEDDFHRSVFTEGILRRLMTDAGLTDIDYWESHENDCAELPVSLNLQGTKVEQPTELEVTIKAVMGVPRYGQMAARGVIEKALRPFKLPLYTFQGVFWGHCMETAFETAVEENVDWILTVDYDSVFTSEHLNALFERLGQEPGIDAICALQVRRGLEAPLLTVGHETSVEVNGHPIKVTTAHFGLTVLRVECLRKMPKPWFWSQPDSDGGWKQKDKKMDDDIWFWHHWREAGHSIYVDPLISIGHVEEMVGYYDETMVLRHMPVDKWRTEFTEGESKC